MNPWTVVGWMIVVVIGLTVVFGGGLLVIALRHERKMRSEFERHHADIMERVRSRQARP